MHILIIGFPRSGTSLTHRIISKHPAVFEMWFEKWILKQANSKEELLKKYPYFKRTTGEKIIWEKRVTGKIGKTDKNIIDYALKWNDWFKQDAKIIQIVRHPYDSLNSLKISKKKFPRGPSFNTVYPEYLNNASRFFDGLKMIPNCLTIKYENLVTDPDNMIRRLYEHCNIDPLYKHSEKMKTRRMFNYKHKDFLFEYDDRLKKIVETLNQIPGIKYDI